MAKVKARLDITADPPILIDAASCDLCGACVGVCPPDVIIMTEKTLRIAGGCIKCGICIPVCPLAALSWNEVEVGAVSSGNGKGLIKTQ